MGTEKNGAPMSETYVSYRHLLGVSAGAVVAICSGVWVITSWGMQTTKESAAMAAVAAAADVTRTVQKLESNMQAIQVQVDAVRWEQEKGLVETARDVRALSKVVLTRQQQPRLVKAVPAPFARYAGFDGGIQDGGP